MAYLFALDASINNIWFVLAAPINIILFTLHPFLRILGSSLLIHAVERSNNMHVPTAPQSPPSARIWNQYGYYGHWSIRDNKILTIEFITFCCVFSGWSLNKCLLGDGPQKWHVQIIGKWMSELKYQCMIFVLLNCEDYGM